MVWAKDIFALPCFVDASPIALNRQKISSSIDLAILCFTPKRFLALVAYCQISTDLDKILHTPIVVRNTLVGRLY